MRKLKDTNNPFFSLRWSIFINVLYLAAASIAALTTVNPGDVPPTLSDGDDKNSLNSTMEKFFAPFVAAPTVAYFAALSYVLFNLAGYIALYRRNPNQDIQSFEVPVNARRINRSDSGVGDDGYQSFSQTHDEHRVTSIEELAAQPVKKECSTTCKKFFINPTVLGLVGASISLIAFLGLYEFKEHKNENAIAAFSWLIQSFSSQKLSVQWIGASTAVFVTSSILSQSFQSIYNSCKPVRPQPSASGREPALPSSGSFGMGSVPV